MTNVREIEGVDMHVSQAKFTILTTAVLLGLFTAACGDNGGDAGPATSKEEVERVAMEELKPDNPGLQAVDCPTGVPAVVGASVRCVLTGDGAKFGLAVEVKQVEDGRSRLAFKVDDAPIAGSVEDDARKSMLKENVERTVQDVLEKDVGQRPDSVECEDGVDAEVGKSVRCVLTAGADRLGLTATVAAVDGNNVRLSVEVDDQPMG